ncbi:dTDP-4-amino-4,6-dideoxygalactose transaminase [Deinobacterium chartae]|uniref:dTDP-4-amino-4,6-dideoxygalactose transaminase n=1 Tax=Deinobacterium chartae TaxID=521158 RepID=A0A841HXX1_9DEIO|nr:DegT/DnrJ/EryC1/StrS family aminotransferase [Deinobacterium chartae]MBB6097494.1 dTDP-4-amino-4,6-dideoxygalactose transaminase [Deinobacterium chartae]
MPDTPTRVPALYGGTPVRSAPLPGGTRFGADELNELREALEQGTLFYHFGGKVKAFARRFAEMHGAPGAVATSSGTAALHVAVGCLDLPPGSEVITSPVTDYGTVIGLLYQGLVPVFADLDPASGLLTPETVEAALSERTGAVLAVHLAGNPCDLSGLAALCERRGIALLEDCAQAYLAQHRGRRVGTFGRFGCFSTNDYKHISTGDGGLVLVRDPADLPLATAFADKNYRRDQQGGMRRVERLAPNVRMTELQGAVGLAQLRRLPEIVSRRRAFGDALRARLQNLPGVTPMRVREGNTCSYWFFTLHLEAQALRCDRDTFAAALRAEGLPVRPGAYLEAPLYRTPLFEQQSAFAGTRYPFDLAPQRPAHCPGAEHYLANTVILEVSEFYDDTVLEDVVEGVTRVSHFFAR